MFTVTALMMFCLPQKIIELLCRRYLVIDGFLLKKKFIDDKYTTLEEYFGEEVCDMMSDNWDIDDFNEFWEPNFWMEEVDYID